MTITILIGICAGLITGLVFAFVSQARLKTQKIAIELDKAKIVDEAQKKAEGIKKEAHVEAKEVLYQAKAEAEKEIRERRSELNHLDKRLRQKEESIEKKYEQIEKRDQELNRKEKDYSLKERSIQDKENACNRLIKEQTDLLEKISELSSEDAKQELLRKIEVESRFEGAKLAKKIEDEARENCREEG